MDEHAQWIHSLRELNRSKRQLISDIVREMDCRHRRGDSRCRDLAELVVKLRREIARNETEIEYWQKLTNLRKKFRCGVLFCQTV